MTTDNARLIRAHGEWLRRTGASPITQRYRRGVLQRLARALPVALLDATPEDLDAWQSRLTVSLSTLVGYTSHVRQFFKWAVLTGRLGADPTRHLPKTKVPRPRPRPVPDADLRVALTCAPEPVRTWLILSAFMGLRAMEVAGMKREDVTEVGGRWYLDGIGKGAKHYRLPVPEHVAPVLRPHLTGRTGPLWRTGPGGRPSRPQDVSEQVVRFFRGIGLHYSLHQLRHTFGTSLYRQTRDLLTTQDAMRHSNPTTTRGYVETLAPAATAAMDKLSAQLEGRRRRGRRRAPARTAEVTRTRANDPDTCRATADPQAGPPQQDPPQHGQHRHPQPPRARSRAEQSPAAHDVIIAPP